MDVMQHFLDQFSDRFFPETHRAVYSAYFGWLLILIRNGWTAWMLRR